MSKLPEGAPASIMEAFGRLNAVTKPTLDDLKIMVFLEASGQASYTELAQSTQNAEVRALLEANAREELGHAHRVSKALKILTGEAFEPPAAADNPYATSMGLTLSPDLLTMLVHGEDNGAKLYELWAENIGDPAVAELFRQNGKEEALHGQRAAKAAALLAA